ncbi:AAA family ATPase, partial [Pseudoalteromonas sp. S1941]
RIMLIPISTGVGLTSVSVGLVRALEQKAVAVNFFKPIAQPRKEDTGPEKSTLIVQQGSSISPPKPFELSYAEQMIGDGKGDDLLEEIVERFES